MEYPGSARLEGTPAMDLELCFCFLMFADTQLARQLHQELFFAFLGFEDPT